MESACVLRDTFTLYEAWQEVVTGQSPNWQLPPLNKTMGKNI